MNQESNTIRHTGRVIKPVEKKREYLQQRINFLFQKLKRNSDKKMNSGIKKKMANLEAESKKYSTILQGVSRKRAKTLKRLSGLKKVHMNRTLQRIKKARNNLTHKHRMLSTVHEEKNNDVNNLASMISKVKV
jgi:paraquat-inducible protein B